MSLIFASSQVLGSVSATMRSARFPTDPNAHLRGEDPQLERAIAEALRLLEVKGVELPAFDGRPHLPLPE